MILVSSRVVQLDLLQLARAESAMKQGQLFMFHSSHFFLFEFEWRREQQSKSEPNKNEPGSRKKKADDNKKATKDKLLPRCIFLPFPPLLSC